MIYLIHNNTEDTFKIGFTENIKSRINALQTGNSTQLKVLKTIEGSKEDEKKVHEKFKDFKISGEWFENNETILEHFDINIENLEYKKFDITLSLIDKILTTNLSKSDLELFFYLIKYFSGNKAFTVTSYIKEEVSKKTGKKVTSYNNSVRALLEHKMIFVASGRSYKINPRYAFEGSSKMRNKAVIEMVSKCKDC